MRARAVDALVIFGSWLGHTTGIYKLWHRTWRRWERWKYGWARPKPADPWDLGLLLGHQAKYWTPDVWWRLFDSISPPGRLAARAAGHRPPRSLSPMLAAMLAGCLAAGLGALWSPWASAPGLLLAMASCAAIRRTGWHSVDCDEFAVDAADALLQDLELHGQVRDGGERLGERVLLLQVIWRRPQDPWWKLQAHHMAICEWLPPQHLRRHLRVGARELNHWAAHRGEVWWHFSNWGRCGPFLSLPALVQGVADAHSEGGRGRVLAGRVVSAETLGDWRRI